MQSWDYTDVVAADSKQKRFEEKVIFVHDGPKGEVYSYLNGQQYLQGVLSAVSFLSAFVEGSGFD